MQYGFVCTRSSGSGDSVAVQRTDEPEEEEEEFLDPNSAFVSVAVSRNKRGSNTTAVGHMDRTQQSSVARRAPVSAMIFHFGCTHGSQFRSKQVRISTDCGFTL
jgi:hypothetical protein